jgi:hypothetical protein
MNIKQKRCPVCCEMYTPKRYGLKITPCCENAGCKLDFAQGVTARSKKATVKKAKPKNKKTVGKLRLDLWDEFSLYIKILHSVDGEWCACYTCDKPIKIGTIDCQGGHCFSKAANGNIYFDDRAVRPQCSRCNCAEEGNHYVFNERLKQEIGMAAWSDMYENRKQLFKKPRQWYIDKIDFYKSEIIKIKELKSAS